MVDMYFVETTPSRPEVCTTERGSAWPSDRSAVMVYDGFVP